MINSIPTHLLFNYNISNSILNHMTTIAKNFFWNIDSSSETITKPKDNGRLGMRDLLQLSSIYPPSESSLSSTIMIHLVFLFV